MIAPTCHRADTGDIADRVEAELTETREALACSRSEQDDRRLRASEKFLCRRLAELRLSAESGEGAAWT